MFGRARRVRLKSFVFEATPRCNHRCLHCYNVWKNPPPYPTGELPTGETLELLDAMLDQTRARLVTLSGGEPLLRSDIVEIVDHLAHRKVSINLLTNGALLDEAMLTRLDTSRVSLFEIPLLSVEADIHDTLSGSPGAHAKVLEAVTSVRGAGGHVVCVFVATRLNLHTLHDTIELAIALGADGIMLNRFNPGGEGGRNIGRLQVEPEPLRRALDVADNLVGRYGVPISCSIAMPPCLFDHRRWPNLGFGFCAAGTKDAYYTLDAVGNVRPCNHSATILGNLRETPFAKLARSRTMKSFMAARPAFCAGCSMERTCLGGCKAAAEVCRGDPDHPDPFLEAFMDQARKPR